MLKKLQKLPRDLALVNHSGIQFVDYGFRLNPDLTFNRNFLERPDGETFVLRPLEIDRQTGEVVDAETREQVTGDSTYSVNLNMALRAFDAVWLPVPFLNGEERGPTNWARVRVCALQAPDSSGNTHRVTLAFDTRREEPIEGRPYTNPTPDDVRNETRFSLVSDLIKNSWFLTEPWVRGWLGDVFDVALKQGKARKPRRRDEEEAQCAFWAHYAVLLQGLAHLIDGETSNAPLPIIRFLDTLRADSPYQPIDVDLVLDIGNSRTCGVLIESGFDAGLDLRNSAPIELRDLSRPENAYTEPFRSHVEFVRPEFGSDYWAGRSGTRNAFRWRSLVRVGPEALRLNSKSSGAEGDTGLSGPKRYLWDKRENRQLWYFNGAESRVDEQKPVFGEFMQFLTQNGDACNSADPNNQPALQPKFSRASLFTFMVIEILMQALVQINSIGTRAERSNPNVPRRLSRLVMTIPTATPLVERDEFQKRCETAVQLLWRAFGWGPDGSATAKSEKNFVNIAYDEATCTQIVYLYSEIAEKARTSPRDVFRAMGGRSTSQGHALRLASLDIGGGTTDLMIVTYEIGKEANALRPRQNFREGFRKAGDDILEAVIAEHVMKDLKSALQQCGLSDTHRFLQGMMSDAGKGALERHKRKLFVTRVLVPIALHLLAQYETSGLFDDPREPLATRDIFGGNFVDVQPHVEFFEQAVRLAGGHDFHLADVTYSLDFEALGRTVSNAMGGIISALCEVIDRFDVDALLVTGRPSRLPIVRDLVLRFLPMMPHHIVFMHDYKVGSWYPFSSPLGTIGDPKTTVVVGALLCTLAEDRRIPDFSISTGRLSIGSTANYIGRIYANTIKQENVIFTRVNGKFPSESLPLIVEEPLFIGFRQLPLERWPATPLFFLDLADGASGGRPSASTMPWRVTFVRDEGDDTPAGRAKATTEAFGVGRIIDRSGDEYGTSRLTLRLQTLSNAEGYWLDTGIVHPV